MTGFIYAVESGGRVKLGFSENPALRFNKIAADAPYPCTLLGYWEGTKVDEDAVHAQFEALRVHREWFAATAELLSFIVEVSSIIPKQAVRFAIFETDTPLAKWRKTKRLTQAEVGAAVGVDKSVFNRWESGKAIPRLKHMVKLTALTGGEVTANDMFEAGQ